MRFSRDRRGQSVVVGTVILFGFLILALSLYQVQVVPQQNTQAEFEHFEEVRNDLVELRAGILRAGSTERPQYQTVRLGTDYPLRLFAINPPAPAGTIRTSDKSYPINITYASNETVIRTIPTRFIEYQPGYNELDRSSIWYDASVLYLDARDNGGGVAVIEDQELVVDNSSLRITAIQNEFRASGTRRVTLEMYLAEEAKNLTDFSGEVNVSIPTRLGADYWSGSSIEEGPVTYHGVDATEYNSSDVSALQLSVNSLDNVTVNSVGVQSEPSDGAVRDNVGPGDEEPNKNPDPEILLRVDDLSHINENQGQFNTSFEVTNVGSNFERTEVEYDYLSGGGGDDTDVIPNRRGRSEYTAGGTSNGNFDITVTVIGTDRNGNEYEMVTRKIEATADARNPVEESLSTTDSASFQNVAVEDRSNNGQGPRYRIDYDVDAQPGFDRVEAYMVSTEPNSGGRDRDQSTDRNGRFDLNTYGYNSEFKIVVLLVDDDNVVVDARIITDRADGTDP